MGNYTAETPKWDLTSRADRGMRVFKYEVISDDLTDGQIVVETNMVGSDPVILARGFDANGILKNGLLDVFSWDAATGDLTVTLPGGAGDFEEGDVLHIMIVATP